MSTIQLAGNTVGGVVQGTWGTYQAASDGTFTVDSRDALAMLTLGMSYIRRGSASYNTLAAPAAASVGRFVASVGLSVGTLSIANQPDVLRPAQVIIGPGTTAISSGSVSVTYLGNDGQAGTDVISAVTAASTPTTTYLSRGVAHITSATVSTIVGGTSPYVYISSTPDLSVPVDPGAQDFAVTKENIETGNETVGALISPLGSITPSTAPNGTHTYGFAFTFISPAQ
jgi:hypothetical protein